MSRLGCAGVRCVCRGSVGRWACGVSPAVLHPWRGGAVLLRSVVLSGVVVTFAVPLVSYVLFLFFR